MNGVNEIREAEFKHEVLESSIPVLVDFFAPWCGPCRALAPILEGIAGALAGRLKVVKVNVDDSPELAVEFGIRGVPTMIVFLSGKVADSIVGLPSLNVLRTKIEAAVAVAANAAA